MLPNIYIYLVYYQDLFSMSSRSATQTTLNLVLAKQNNLKARIEEEQRIDARKESSREGH